MIKSCEDCAWGVRLDDDGFEDGDGRPYCTTDRYPVRILEEDFTSSDFDCLFFERRRA